MLTAVLVRKSFRYRVYPSAEQVARLAGWDGALRFLWNLANEQRLLGLARHCVYRRHLDEHGVEIPDAGPSHRHVAGAVDERVFPTAFDQINELTALRAELPWLADVPRNVCAQLLVELDLAWQRCFQGLAARPRWKRKGRSTMSFCEPHPKTWRLDGTTLRFPKLGNMPLVLHRPLEGKPKMCRLVREVDQWFAVISCEVEVAEPASRTSPVVAIDRGVINAFADSAGRLVENPRFLASQARRIARAQRAVDRKKKGSQNQKKARTRVAKLYRKVRRQRDHFLHVESARYAKNHGVVVVEKLHVRAMTRSAKGTVEEPGKHVAQKAGLNRSILDVGWSRFAGFLTYKLARTGGTLVEVPAAYSSQTCSACGHVDAESRTSQAVFQCVKCGFSEHADLNAAKVLLQRFQHRANRSVLPVEGSPSGALRSRKRLRVARRNAENSALTGRG